MVPLTADTLGGTYWLQLDTGTPHAIWLYAGPVDDLLGKMGVERDKSAPFVISSASFGEPVTIVGAPASGDLTLGSATLEHPLIFHMRDGPERLRIENWSSGGSGVIGNELFADRYLVAIDLPHGRFGLVDRSTPKE